MSVISPAQVHWQTKKAWDSIVLCENDLWKEIIGWGWELLETETVFEGSSCKGGSKLCILEDEIVKNIWTFRDSKVSKRGRNKEIE